MEVWGAKCIPSPSPDTNVGRTLLKEDPNHPGSLGIAISEACEDAFSRDDTQYSLGSVLNHVLMHQTIIGLETKKAMMEKADVYPDIIVGCIGGGSKIEKKHNPKVIVVEPTSCPTVTKGPLTWDLGDAVGMAPIAFMHTLGHTFIPPPVHAGGLRYHGIAPIVSHCVKLGLIEARAVPQLATFEAGIQFARTEGYISAPETNHAIRVVIDEALKCKAEGKSKVILLAHSGHGHFDMGAYDQYLSGKLQDYDYPEDMVKEALTHLPEVKV
jgi:tryptophan synthase beta chain